MFEFCLFKCLSQLTGIFRKEVFLKNFLSKQFLTVKGNFRAWGNASAFKQIRALCINWRLFSENVAFGFLFIFLFFCGRGSYSSHRKRQWCQSRIDRGGCSLPASIWWMKHSTEEWVEPTGNPGRVNMGSPCFRQTENYASLGKARENHLQRKPRTLAPKQAKHSVTNIQQAWWPTFVMSSLQRLWQDCEFWTSLSNKQTNKTKPNRNPGGLEREWPLE